MTCSHGRSQEGGHGGDAFLLAYYFCCATHYLNLSASSAVKVSATQNAENVTQKVVKMFKTSAKKTALLKSSITDVSSQGETKRYLVSLCETRFVERHVSIPVKHSKLGAKNFNKVCPITVQNALKWLQVLQYTTNLRWHIIFTMLTFERFCSCKSFSNTKC